jgi:DDE superfamily endonuclease
VIDDSGIPKKGTKSAGVAPQDCGVRHAVVNCQVGVVACDVTGREMALVDRELYLPAVWTTDQERCQAAGVPESVGFATKPQLAVGMLARLLGRLPAAWWPRMRCMAPIPGCGPGWRAAGGVGAGHPRKRPPRGRQRRRAPPGPRADRPPGGGRLAAA